VNDKVQPRVRACQTRGCGHDRATHYRDSRGEGNCLAFGGCECRGFQEERDTQPNMRATREPFRPAND
jgi:hypothetical protein